MSRDVLWELLRRSRDHVALAVARNPQYDDGLLASINMALEAYDEKVDIVWSPSEEPNIWGNYEQHATAADYHGASAFHDCLVSVVPSFNKSNEYKISPSPTGSPVTISILDFGSIGDTFLLDNCLTFNFCKEIIQYMFI